MSTLPPNLVGSILQTNLAQRQLSRVRDNERAQEVNLEQKQASAVNEKDSTVETTDGDTQVYSDGQGGGSQGRAFSSPDDAETLTPEPPTPTAEEQGRLIDFEA